MFTARYVQSPYIIHIRFSLEKVRCAQRQFMFNVCFYLQYAFVNKTAILPDPFTIINHSVPKYIK